MPILNSFSELEKDLLQRLAGSIIATSKTRGLPGADNDRIFASILARAEPVTRMSEDLTDCFSGVGGVETLLELGDREFRTCLESVRKTQHAFLSGFMILVAQSYYQDEGVLEILGRDGSPPYPRGNVLEQGDWSLLDPVKHKAPFYRKC